jgi:hypothetical protein
MSSCWWRQLVSCPVGVAVSFKCPNCSVQFEETSKDCQLTIYLEDHECNNIRITCPKGHSTDLYIDADALRHFWIGHLLTKIDLIPRASDEQRSAARRFWQPTPELDVQPAPAALRELYDDLRRFEQGET